MENSRIYPVFMLADVTINALGFSSAEVAEAMWNNNSGIRLTTERSAAHEPAQLALISRALFQQACTPSAWDTPMTFFEQLLACCLQRIVEQTGVDLRSPRLRVILSSTKGNVELLDSRYRGDIPSDRLLLSTSAALLKASFHLAHNPWVISNACVSGTQALLCGQQLLSSGTCDEVVVCGADVLSPFVVSGFQSFKALSPELCRPFDAHRQGLNLGEGAAAVLLSRIPSRPDDVAIAAGASANDANHISGPSRTGEGLFRAVQKALARAQHPPLAFINAHGTATPYNDEMEAVAFSRANLTNIPVNSYKAYFGHTLGAAGLMEVILSAHALKKERMFATLAYESLGVSVPILLSNEAQDRKENACLKTASGFGGTNVAMILTKGGRR